MSRSHRFTHQKVAISNIYGVIVIIYRERYTRPLCTHQYPINFRPTNVPRSSGCVMAKKEATTAKITAKMYGGSATHKAPPPKKVISKKKAFSILDKPAARAELLASLKKFNDQM